MAWQVLRAGLIRSCPDLIILWSLKYYPVKNQKKGKTPLKLPNDSNTKTLNTRAHIHAHAHARAYTYKHTRTHTTRVLLTSLPAVSDTGHPAAAAVAWVPSLGLRRRRGGSAATVQGRGAGRSARVLGSVRSARGTTRPTCPNPLLPLPHRAGRQQPGSLTDPESPKFCDPTPPPGLSPSSRGLWRGRWQMAGWALVYLSEPLAVVVLHWNPPRGRLFFISDFQFGVFLSYFSPFLLKQSWNLLYFKIDF